MTRDDARVTALLTACHSLIEFYMLIFPVVLGLMASSLGVGLFQVSILGNIAYFAYGLGALPSGFLTDRFGARPLLTVSVLGVGISSVMIALSKLCSSGVFHALLWPVRQLISPCGAFLPVMAS